jgi:hypothetical protein
MRIEPRAWRIKADNSPAKLNEAACWFQVQVLVRFQVRIIHFYLSAQGECV